MVNVQLVVCFKQKRKVGNRQREAERDEVSVKQCAVHPSWNSSLGEQGIDQPDSMMAYGSLSSALCWKLVWTKVRGE